MMIIIIIIIELYFYVMCENFTNEHLPFLQVLSLYVSHNYFLIFFCIHHTHKQTDINRSINQSNLSIEKDVDFKRISSLVVWSPGVLFRFTLFYVSYFLPIFFVWKSFSFKPLHLLIY